MAIANVKLHIWEQYIIPDEIAITFKTSDEVLDYISEHDSIGTEIDVEYPMPSENEGLSTVEIYNTDSELIFKNGN